MVLVSLEIWSGWLDLRYALLPDEPPAVPAGFDLAFDWRASDDQGTEYELAGAASSGGRLLRVHQLSFRPGLADGARSLTLTVSEHRADGPLAVVEIELAPEA
jgi:hypothetical protein